MASSRPRLLRPSFWALAAASAPLLLLAPAAGAQSASAAKSRVSSAVSLIESERYDDAERTLADAEKFLEGLPDAEKAPVIKQIAETRATLESAKKVTTARLVKSRLESDIRSAADDIGPRTQDAEKKITKITARLESEEVTKALDAAEISKLKARLEEVKKKLAGGAEPPKPAVEANAGAARTRVMSARNLVESRRFENVEYTLEEAEKYLVGLSEAEKAPILRDIAEVRKLLADGEKAEKVRIIEERIDRYLRSADGRVPHDTGKLIADVAALLATDDVKNTLSPEKISEFTSRLEESKAMMAATIKRTAMERVDGFIADLESALSGDPFEGMNEFDAYKAWRDLDYRYRAAHKWLADIPADDPDVRAAQAKLADLKKKIDNASSNWTTAQVEAAIQGGWDFICTTFAGWEDETPDTALKPNEMWRMQKTAIAVCNAAHWLDDANNKALYTQHAGNAVVKATVESAQKTRDAAAAKLDAAFNQAMSNAEAMPTPIRASRFDRVIASWMANDAEECFKGTKYQEANVARAKALDARWEKEITAIEQAAAELRAKLSKEADKAWPAIVDRIDPEEDFRARQLARSEGDCIILKGVYNRTGWDFDGTYDFTVRIDGVAIGGNYTKEIIDSIEAMWEKMDAPPLTDREQWDVVAVVEGPAKLKRRITTKIIDAMTREEIGRIEGHEVEDGVEVRIIGLHAGPIAVGSK